MRTLVVRIETHGLFENGLAFVGILGERSGIQHFFDRKLGGIVHILLANLVVGATHHPIIDGQTRAAQFGQHFIGQFGEGCRDVANLLLAFFGILVERKHTNDGFFVLNVALLHQFFEAFPVFGGVFRVDVGAEFIFAQLSVHILLGRVATVLSQFFIEAQRAVGRGVSCHFDVVERQILAVGFDLAQHFHEVLHRGAIDFAGAHFGLVDEILDLCVLSATDLLLIAVGCRSGRGGCEGAVDQLRGGEHTVGHFHLGNGDTLVADAGIEGQIELAAIHGGSVGEIRAHHIVATHLVGDGLVVAHHVFSLESGALSHRTRAGIAQFGHNGDDGLFLHVLFGETAVDCGRNGVAYHFERRGGNGEIVGRKRSKLPAARTQHEEAEACHGDSEGLFHE